MKTVAFSSRARLAVLVGWAAVFVIFVYNRGNLSFIEGLTSVTRPLRRALGHGCALLPFSVAETVVIVFFSLVFFYLCGVVRLARRRGTGQLARGLLGLVTIGVSVYGGFTLLWGADYFLPGVAERMDLTRRPATGQTLYAVTQDYAQSLAAISVPRDERGLFCLRPEDFWHTSQGLYDKLARQYPFLAGDYAAPKALSFSRVLSATRYTGFYFPFTGEANLNIDAPPCLMPATIAHEMAHQRGVAAEDEANFIAVLACRSCGDPVYEYAGSLLAYIHLSNALYEVSPTLWQQIWDALPPTVRADLRENNRYWSQFTSPAARASEKIYDTFLKSYDQPLGARTYGAVVDLLIAHWLQQNGD